MFGRSVWRQIEYHVTIALSPPPPPPVNSCNRWLRSISGRINPPDSANTMYVDPGMSDVFASSDF